MLSAETTRLAAVSALRSITANDSSRELSDNLFATVGEINATLSEAMREPAVVERLTTLGFEPVVGSPDEFARFIQADVERSSALLRAVNYQPQ